jgi:hypothetical protein
MKIGETGRGGRKGDGRRLNASDVARLRRAGLDPHRLHVARAPVQHMVDAPVDPSGRDHDLARPQVRAEGGS